MRNFQIRPRLIRARATVKVAQFEWSSYNESMFKLRELVKECIDYTRENMNGCENMTDEELFSDVMENVMSMVLDYTYWDYEMDEE